MLRAYGLYSHIQRNRMVSVLLLASFMVLLQALSFSFALLFEAYRGGTVAQMIARAGADMRLAAPAGLFAASIWFLARAIFRALRPRTSMRGWKISAFRAA